MGNDWHNQHRTDGGRWGLDAVVADDGWGEEDMRPLQSAGGHWASGVESMDAETRALAGNMVDFLHNLTDEQLEDIRRSR